MKNTDRVMTTYYIDHIYQSQFGSRVREHVKVEQNAAVRTCRRTSFIEFIDNNDSCSFIGVFSPPRFGLT